MLVIDFHHPWWKSTRSTRQLFLPGPSSSTTLRDLRHTPTRLSSDWTGPGDFTRYTATVPSATYAIPLLKPGPLPGTTRPRSTLHGAQRKYFRAVRYYGFHANRVRGKLVPIVLELLGLDQTSYKRLQTGHHLSSSTLIYSPDLFSLRQPTITH